MNVLHYSFSLSACPKCHLLICKHTSLADLDFNFDQQQIQCSNTTISIENNVKISSQQHLSDGTNFYIFPSTIIDNRYSWTTFGTDFNESTNTINNSSSNNETICENIPFANENILNSTLVLTPTINQIVLTQSEKFTHIKHLETSIIKTYSYSTISFLLIFLLILSFLITNTIDIVLVYIYYHTNYIYLISFLSIIILCDIILWINNLIQSNSISFYLLFIPFNIRFYLLYELLELLIILFDKNHNRQLLNSLYKIKKQKLYHNLTLFYFIHTGFLVFINLYIWSNNFQFSTKLFLNMDYFIPQWIIKNDLLSSTLTNWNISNPIPASSLFVLISILYNLIINYSLLSAYLIYKRFSFIIILSRLCLIIPRIYTFIFLFHLNSLWLSITLFIIHLMLILIFNRTKLKFKQNKIFLKIIFSLITHQTIDDISINLLILLENTLIFLHRIYFEIFALHHYQITIRLSIFISILILFQFIGFICKHIFVIKRKSII